MPNSVHFDGSLLHELGHDLGLGHPDDCGDPNYATICPTTMGQQTLGCGAMSPNLGVQSRDVFGDDDQDGLRALYGQRTVQSLRSFERSGSWYELPSVTFTNLTGYVSASSSPIVSGSVLIAGYSRGGDVPQATRWDYASTTFTPLTIPTFSLAGGALGAAQSTTTEYVVSHSARMSSDFRRWSRRTTVSTRAVGGSGWTSVQTNPSANALDDSYAAGVNTAYDSRSGRLLFAFRANDGRVVLQAHSGGTFTNFVDTNTFTLSNPAIACAETSAVSRNCILVFWEETPPASRLQWREFGFNVSGGVASWNPGSVRTEPWLLHGTPRVGVRAAGGGVHEFYASFTRSIGTTSEVWVIRKNLGEANSFGN